MTCDPGTAPRRGAGPHRQWSNCKTGVALARASGTGASVRWRGYRDSMPELLLAADVFAVSSTCEEAIELVALEVQTTGSSLDVSGIGDLAEVVTDGATDLFASPHGAVALAKVVLRLFTERDLVRRLAATGRISAERFGLDAHLLHMMALIEEVHTARHGAGYSPC